MLAFSAPFRAPITVLHRLKRPNCDGLRYRVTSPEGSGPAHQEERRLVTEGAEGRGSRREEKQEKQEKVEKQEKRNAEDTERHRGHREKPEKSEEKDWALRGWARVPLRPMWCPEAIVEHHGRSSLCSSAGTLCPLCSALTLFLPSLPCLPRPTSVLSNRGLRLRRTRGAGCR